MVNVFVRFNITEVQDNKLVEAVKEPGEGT